MKIIFCYLVVLWDVGIFLLAVLHGDRKRAESSRRSRFGPYSLHFPSGRQPIHRPKFRTRWHDQMISTSLLLFMKKLQKIIRIKNGIKKYCWKLENVLMKNDMGQRI